MHRGVLWLGAAAWLPLCALAGAAEPQPPYIGEVTKARSYIRAGDGINYTVLRIAEAGERVEVTGQRFEWLKVAVPEKCTVWVYKSMLSVDLGGKEATVARDRVNVRARPSLQGDIMGQLEKGTRLKVVDEDGEWVGVAPPGCAAAWVHKDCVRKVEEAAVAKPPAKEEKKGEGMEADAASALLRKAQELYQAELAKPADQRNFDEALAAYQKVASQSEDPEVASRAERARQRLLKIVDIHNALRAAREPLEQFDKKYKDLEAEYKRRAQEAEKRQEK